MGQGLIAMFVSATYLLQQCPSYPAQQSTELHSQAGASPINYCRCAVVWKVDMLHGTYQAFGVMCRHLSKFQNPEYLENHSLAAQHQGHGLDFVT